MSVLPSSAILIAVLAQAAPSPRDEAAERLKFMKDSVAVYEFTRESGPLKLVSEPAFRLGNQGNGVLEGAIFLWTDPKTDRPGAAAQVFLHRNDLQPEGRWLHEFTSLSTDPFVAARGRSEPWKPEGPGVVFKPVPGAPAPAATPAARLRQMRALAQSFKAVDDFGNHGTFEPLRLLTTPVARYGKPGVVPEDGALFAFVQGTDPEVFLFLELRKGKDGLEWQYACAPMSCWPLKVSRDNAVVWDVPLRSSEDPSKPFFCLTYVP